MKISVACVTLIGLVSLTKAAVVRAIGNENGSEIGVRKDGNKNGVRNGTDNARPGNGQVNENLDNGSISGGDNGMGRNTGSSICKNNGNCNAVIDERRENGNTRTEGVNGNQNRLFDNGGINGNANGNGNIGGINGNLNGNGNVNTGNNRGGISYTRWGRPTCPGSSIVLYEGYVAVGLGGDLMCFPLKPDEAQTNGAATSFVYLASVTFYPENKTSDTRSPSNGKQIPCALCQVQISHQVMVPGWSSCVKMIGWSRLYSGFLMASSSREKFTKQSMQICVDLSPDLPLKAPPSLDHQLAYVTGPATGTKVKCVICGL